MMTGGILKFLLENWPYLALALVSGGMLLWQSLRGIGPQLGPQQATLLMNRENAIVIDIRDAQGWSAGHIPQARHIVLDQLEQRLAEIEKFKDKPIIVSCQSGQRSLIACRRLRKAGFSQVFNLAGGLAAWREAGLPITSK